jgi:creatinine amidohydrolase
MTAVHRRYGSLTSPQAATAITGESVLCLPVGATEQHGPHLPLDTDTVVAERFTERLVAHYGPHHDLWSLPALPLGLSPEHAWAPGTATLPAGTFLTVLHEVVRAYARATPARRLLIVNGHGGNRGILEAATHELRSDPGQIVCVIHPSALSPVRADGPVPEVHAGTWETALMLALAPDEVHLDQLPAGSFSTSRTETIRRTVLDRGTTWPWTSDDPAIASHGVIGNDPRDATAQLGHAILDGALDAAGRVLGQLVRTPAPAPGIDR